MVVLLVEIYCDYKVDIVINVTVLFQTERRCYTCVRRKPVNS